MRGWYRRGYLRVITLCTKENPRSYGSIVYMMSCRMSIVGSLDKASLSLLGAIGSMSFMVFVAVSED